MVNVQKDMRSLLPPSWILHFLVTRVFLVASGSPGWKTGNEFAADQWDRSMFVAMHHGICLKRPCLGVASIDCFDCLSCVFPTVACFAVLRFAQLILGKFLHPFFASKTANDPLNRFMSFKLKSNRRAWFHVSRHLYGCPSAVVLASCQALLIWKLLVWKIADLHAQIQIFPNQNF